MGPHLLTELRPFFLRWTRFPQSRLFIIRPVTLALTDGRSNVTSSRELSLAYTYDFDPTLILLKHAAAAIVRAFDRHLNMYSLLKCIAINNKQYEKFNLQMHVSK